mmetsp:Transcript_54570/g.145734  ORF Transcript_54570/g.145734 Transcript_54570/m.145734 type:complete len:143 (-) Transcript_54570:146-574(-)
MVKRKRHKKKADLSNVKVKLVKKRGRTVMTTETELKQTTEELTAELQKLKELKSDLRKSKQRRRNQPAPISERKALDHLPLDAGLRVDKRARRERMLARREERRTRRLRREKILADRDARGFEEVDIKDTLGEDFFAAREGS